MDLIAVHEIHKRNLCDKLKIFHMEEPLYRYSLVWYYGAKVKLNRRVEIDQGISELREKDIISPRLVREQCSDNEAKINQYMLALPVICADIPFFIYISFYLIYISYKADFQSLK